MLTTVSNLIATIYYYYILVCTSLWILAIAHELTYLLNYIHCTVLPLGDTMEDSKGTPLDNMSGLKIYSHMIHIIPTNTYKYVQQQLLCFPNDILSVEYNKKSLNSHSRLTLSRGVFSLPRR